MNLDFGDFIKYLNQVEHPIETKAYNEATGRYHERELNEPVGFHPNRVYNGFNDGGCYQRKHRRHYIQKNTHKFPFTITVTLPVTQTSWWLGDVSKNGLFVIGGEWDLETWSPYLDIPPFGIPHYTCVYQPPSDWHVRNTQ